MSSTAKPARSRTVECRPSAPTTRSARTSSGPSGVVARTPATRPSVFDQLGRPRPASAAGTSGSAVPWSARKSRKSHCGIRAMNRQRVGRCEKSAIVTGSPPTHAVQLAHLLVRPLQEFVEEPELVHDLERRRDGWCRRGSRGGNPRASRGRRLDAGAREQEAEHHPGGTAAGDAASGLERHISPSTSLRAGLSTPPGASGPSLSACVPGSLPRHCYPAAAPVMPEIHRWPHRFSAVRSARGRAGCARRDRSG